MLKGYGNIGDLVCKTGVLALYLGVVFVCFKYNNVTCERHKTPFDHTPGHFSTDSDTRLGYFAMATWSIIECA